MKTVYKYPVLATDHFTLELPRGAQVLTAQAQGDSVQLWALVDPAAALEKRLFRVAGTGHEINADEDVILKYVSTFQMLGGQLVFHVFEIA